MKWLFRLAKTHVQKFFKNRRNNANLTLNITNTECWEWFFCRCVELRSSFSFFFKRPMMKPDDFTFDACTAAVQCITGFHSLCRYYCHYHYCICVVKRANLRNSHNTHRFIIPCIKNVVCAVLQLVVVECVVDYCRHRSISLLYVVLTRKDERSTQNV